MWLGGGKVETNYWLTVRGRKGMKLEPTVRGKEVGASKERLGLPLPRECSSVITPGRPKVLKHSIKCSVVRNRNCLELFGDRLLESVGIHYTAGGKELSLLCNEWAS